MWVLSQPDLRPAEVHAASTCSVDWLLARPCNHHFFSATLLFFFFPTSAVFVAATSAWRARSCFGSISGDPPANRGPAKSRYSVDSQDSLASQTRPSAGPNGYGPRRSGGPLWPRQTGRLFFLFSWESTTSSGVPPLDLSAVSLRARPPALLSHCLIFYFSHPLPVPLHINLSRSPSLASSHLLLCGHYHCYRLLLIRWTFSSRIANSRRPTAKLNPRRATRVNCLHFPRRRRRDDRLWSSSPPWARYDRHAQPAGGYGRAREGCL